MHREFKFQFVLFSTFVIIIVSILTLAHFVFPGLNKYLKEKELNLKSFETNLFVCYYKSNENYAKKMCDSAENFLTMFDAKFKDTFGSKKTNGKIFVYLLENRDDLGKLAQKRFAIDMVYNSGYYDSQDKAIAILLSHNPISDETTFYHELVHMKIDASIGITKPFFSEGCAMYFQNYNPTLNKFTGLNESFYTNLMQFKNEITIEKLIKATSSDFSSKENFKFYIASACFVEFLIHINLYENWLKMESQTNGRYDIYDLKIYLGKSLEEFEKEWLKSLDDKLNQ